MFSGPALHWPRCQAIAERTEAARASARTLPRDLRVYQARCADGFVALAPGR